MNLTFNRPLMIAFEGPDLSGKSSLIGACKELLLPKVGHVHTRHLTKPEPGEDSYALRTLQDNPLPRHCVVLWDRHWPSYQVYPSIDRSSNPLSPQWIRAAREWLLDNQAPLVYCDCDRESLRRRYEERQERLSLEQVLDAADAYSLLFESLEAPNPKGKNVICLDTSDTSPSVRDTAICLLTRLGWLNSNER